MKLHYSNGELLLLLSCNLTSFSYITSLVCHLQANMHLCVGLSYMHLCLMSAGSLGLTGKHVYLDFYTFDIQWILNVKEQTAYLHSAHRAVWGRLSVARCSATLRPKDPAGWQYGYWVDPPPSPGWGPPSAPSPCTCKRHPFIHSTDPLWTWLLFGQGCEINWWGVTICTGW